MEFFLNQKSLPMIRKCINCRAYIKDYKACGLMFVYNAYDYQKKIYMNTGDNLYCPRHTFKNEDVLEQEAVVVEFDSIQDAMEAINKSKDVKEHKKGYFIDDEDF